MNTKQTFFKETFEKPFTLDNFVKFSKEFFNNLELVNPGKLLNDYWNWTEFSYYINGYYHIANFTGNDKNKIAIFAVMLKDHKNLDRARSIQRNFVKKLMNSAKIDGAIVAFYAENESKWRMSFVKLDYEFAKGKITEKITPAKRYSYLVGEGEPCHTAMERLYPIFMNEATNPTIEEIEDAFSVEKVTKEFFEKYKEKYFQLKEHLEKNDDFLAEAYRLHFTSEQFAKKLMGQLAFLYFIQKKGWLGVNAFPREPITKKQYNDAFYKLGKASKECIPKVFKQINEEQYQIVPSAIDDLSKEEQEMLATSIKGQPWGTGPRQFIRDLFNVAKRKNANFFDEYLEPLFYDALNTKRGANGYYHGLKCRVPFLNGGLFEPLDNYDWSKNKFDIPNEMFSNIEEKGSHDANGILDIFDRYNFTMNEDEPLEKEVAVDPEMLGKIFENLLDAKDRKSTGAFYTPREIVHYMCQESLVNYLVDETKISYDAIKDFIVYGEFMKDEDTAREAKQGINELYISKEILDRENNINRLKDLDDALANIKVADPAVGSGAFPLGMISEIVRARRNITDYTAMLMENKFVKNEMYKAERHPLSLKLHTIKNSIFAVDIEPSAVDITKLRLWLSLIVEQEINEDNDDDGLYAESRNPKPLPNLDCNIRCGNSLVDELDGIKLINESELLGNLQYQTMLGQNQYKSLLVQLFEAQDKLFYEKNHDEKETLKRKIRAIIDRVVMFNIEGCPETAQKYNQTKGDPSPPYFLWQLEFARVFSKNGGFDVVIGNPPYIDSENMVNNGMEELRNTITKNYKYTKGNWDIYIAFFEKSFNLVSEKGNLCFITPDKWISKPFGDELRRNLIENIRSILAAGRSVFESALVDSIITLISKKPDTKIAVYEMEDKKSPIILKRIVDKSVLADPYPLDIVFSRSIDFIDRLIKSNATLGSKYVCENACATSDCYKLKDILYSLEDINDFDKEKHYKVINTGTIGRFVSRWGNQPIKYLKDKYDFPVVDKKLFLDLFPNSYGKKAGKKKIVIKGLTLLDGSLDIEGIIVPGKSTMIISSDHVDDLKLVSSIVNCKLMIYFIKQKYSSSSYNGGINFTKDMINALPMADISNESKMALVRIVDQIISEKQNDLSADTSALEVQIDQMVYKLYNLTEEEVRIVEESVK